MIATAMFEVTLAGETEATEFYKHTWQTEDINTAIAELATWQVGEKLRIEQQEDWKMKLVQWIVQERPDIGY
jgi:hypothetical protein